MGAPRCGLCGGDGWRTPKDSTFDDYGSGRQLWDVTDREGLDFWAHAACLEGAGWDYDGAPDGAGWTPPVRLVCVEGHGHAGPCLLAEAAD